MITLIYVSILTVIQDDTSSEGTRKRRPKTA